MYLTEALSITELNYDILFFINSERDVLGNKMFFHATAGFVGIFVVVRLETKRLTANNKSAGPTDTDTVTSQETRSKIRKTFRVIVHPRRRAHSPLNPNLLFATHAQNVCEVRTLTCLNACACVHVPRWFPKQLFYQQTRPDVSLLTVLKQTNGACWGSTLAIDAICSLPHTPKHS